MLRETPRSAPVCSANRSAINPSLFDHPADPPSVAVDTSEEAAEAIRCITPKLRRQVFAAILSTGGATCDELCHTLGRGGNTIRPRLRELEDQTLIVKSDRRRPTASGCMAVVYEATAKGITAYREAA